MPRYWVEPPSGVAGEPLEKCLTERCQATEFRRHGRCLEFWVPAEIAKPDECVRGCSGKAKSGKGTCRERKPWRPRGLAGYWDWLKSLLLRR